MFCFKTISDPSLLLSFRRSCCSLSGPDSWPLSCNWPLIPHPPPLDIFFLLDATKRDGARRDASMSAVMLLRSWLDSLGSVVCPDVLDSHSAWEQEKRNDWDQASSWGGILAWIWHHGAELIDRRLWEFFTYIHAPRLGTKREGGVNTLSRRRPVVVPGYQRVRQLKSPLTYGKMESGAEASPQHLPRRKAVLHSLEDQKRVSY